MTTFLAGNKRLLYLGTQSAKGTAQTTPTQCFRLTDFTRNDVRETIQLAETDASAQEADDVVVGLKPGFTFKAYVRPSQFAFLVQALLGHNVDGGTTGAYTHTADPDETPYLTAYEVEPDVLCNRDADCRVTSLQVTGGAGQALEVTVVVEALSFLAGETAPSSPTAGSEQPYVYPEVTVTKGVTANGTVDQFDITISRNGSRAQGDNGMSSLDYVNGKFSVAGSITKFMSDDADQRQVDTGSTTGTTPTTTIFTEALTILIARTADLRILFDMTLVRWSSRQAGIKTDGTPLMEVMGFRTVPQATIADNLQIVTSDALATPDS